MSSAMLVTVMHKELFCRKMHIFLEVNQWDMPSLQNWEISLTLAFQAGLSLTFAESMIPIFQRTLVTTGLLGRLRNVSLNILIIPQIT